MADDGSYTNFAKVRGSKQAFNKLVKLATEILDRGRGKVIIMTGTMKEEAEALKSIFEKHQNTIFMHCGTITPAVGYKPEVWNEWE